MCDPVPSVRMRDDPMPSHSEPGPLRIVAVDHFFGQDLDTLRSRLGELDQCTVLPYQRIRRIAQRHFPKEAFEGVATAFDPRFESCWTSYRHSIARFTRWILSAYRPNVLLLPSDSIFYLRPVIEQFRNFGVRVAVVQKETTISPMTMANHAATIRRFVPFTSDITTVCSQRHRLFQIECGTPSGLIVVTGQPRFDVYRAPTVHRIPSATGLPHLLYLSYDDRAYLPLDSGCCWQELRRQTELVISEAARSGRWRVTAKRHPQQRPGADWLDPAVEVANQSVDTRQLLLEADVVVGFQTTALLEAAAARRPVLYAAWGPVFDANHAQLIPYDKHPECVTHAAGPEHLAELLGRGPEALPRPTTDADPFIGEHLGVIDGGASERVIHVLRSLAASARPTAEAGVPASLFLESVGMAVALPFLAGAGVVLRRLGRVATASSVSSRRTQWRQQVHEAASQMDVAGRHGSPGPTR